MSRPKKTAEGRRSRHVIFRLTDEEYNTLCGHADKAGLSPNELARRLIRKGQRRLVIHTHRQCDPAFLKRIDQIGHNLNQVVKNAHIFGRVSPRLAMLCEAIEQIVMQAVEDATDDS